MCTSLTYLDTTNQHYFARTMDFPTTTPWRPIFLPRHYQWPTGLATARTTQYAILGGGRAPAHFDSYLMADGINETGLTCAELYLPHAATYADHRQSGKINLTPQAFINWVLGEHQSVTTVIADLPLVNLVGASWGDDTGEIYPFHWYLSDSQQSIVIEPTGGPLIAQPNPVGVLTNTPILTDHQCRLNRYLGLAGSQISSATYHAAKQLVQTRQPLPNSPIPTERFIHMAIRRLGTPQLSAQQVPATVFHWLHEVSLPYDARRRNLISHNYTHYRCLITLETRHYRFIPRTTGREQALTLTPKMAATWHAPYLYPTD
ncbi:linear amide C-N hydrolase [Lactiplantibacillus paraplantarum]|uniref:linear amide C-N hydrolase n=1 Tax=Lactiplantibacillus paraplantarum TaxID=60520 RepID=UPI0023AB3FCA|nr:linear amide C-N hydrolase [Lactiplantibacillus paraplantarum]WEE35176.1 linear amide C-N hydrolase [Lactiplantibacillus paraplantarum]